MIPAGAPGAVVRDSVAIVGAGVGGLTAAAYLSRAGLDVSVYEQHAFPGGYVSSFERDGFVFPAGPTSFGSNGVVFPILSELGLADRCHFLPGAHQISWAEHDIPLLDPEQLAHDLARRFPDVRRGLKRYFRWVRLGGSGFKTMLESGLMFGRGVLRTMIPLLVRHPLFPWALLVALGRTNQGLHERYFRDSLVRRVFDQLGYPVMAARNTLGMWMTYFHDTWVPRGGMQEFADLLVRYIREHGGRVHLRTAVERIRVIDGSAVGLTLADGSEIAARWVVSAADLHHTCFDLIGPEHLPRALIAKFERTRPSETAFAVYLGLRGGSEIDRALERFGASHVSFCCADGTCIQLALLSKDDPSVAPAGRHALFVGGLVPYSEWEPLKDDRAAYLDRKAKFAGDLISRAEEFIPGLGEHIEVQDAASPLTYERYTRNWQAGTAGWSWDPKRAPSFRLGDDLPIQQLYAVGHYVFNPGGVPTAMITAWYIAREILKRRIAR